MLEAPCHLHSSPLLWQQRLTREVMNSGGKSSQKQKHFVVCFFSLFFICISSHLEWIMPPEFKICMYLFSQDERHCHIPFQTKKRKKISALNFVLSLEWNCFLLLRITLITEYSSTRICFGDWKRRPIKILH